MNEKQQNLQPSKHNGGNIMKKLTRINQGKMLCGVCTGIADYFNLDPTVIRVIFAILTCMGGSGILAYIAAAVIMPTDNTEIIQ